MRLIDADLFLENARKELNCEGKCCECEHDNLCEIYKMVNEQPTAYDVDNAVEELRDLLWDCYTDSGIGIGRETGFKAYEREMERIVKQNRR